MERIAIIGISCLFPGATTPAEYWQNLLDEADLTSQATAAQMGVDPNIFYHPDKGQTDKFYSMRGGYVRDFTFDPHGYQLPAEVLGGLDTVFTWPLYVGREALRDSGYFDQPETLGRTGLVLGNLSFPTKASHRLLLPLYRRTIETGLQQMLEQKINLPQLDPMADEPLNAHNILTSGQPAAVTAQGLGLGAANLALDAACASSLYAVKLACQYLLAGKADLMLAGAVSAADPVFINMGFSIFHAYPENGISRPLDKASQGLVAGEGAGMFVLKRYDDAVRDGDQIYAVIRGIGLSNDGRGKHLLSPNSKGQKLVFERAYASANLDPTEVEYVECHATGTPLGDVTELNSMSHFFGQHGEPPQIGSAKSNLGHLLTAAGMAGMTKVILSMAHQQIPATIQIDQPQHSDQQDVGADKIVTKLTPKSLNVAGVSAFGFGGTNAHLVLERPPPLTLTPSRGEGGQTSPPLGGTEGGLNSPPLGGTEGGQTSPPLGGTEGGLNSTQLAIIGMEAHFGPCRNLAEFRETIYHSRAESHPLPANRWKGIEQNDTLLTELGLEQVPHGAYIDSFDLDFLKYRIPPNDTDRPDPQQLIILKVVDQALRDAGFDPTRKMANVAILVAMGTELSLHQFRGRVDLTWQLRDFLAEQGLELSAPDLADLETRVKDSLRPEAKVNQYISYIGNIMANRISALWDFSGPSFTISNEETAAFRALEVAQMLLAANEVEAVVVGAVDLAGSIEQVWLRQQLHPTNSGPFSLSYAHSATGWQVGEGAGAIVLKRADAVEPSSERVYATIDALSFAKAGTLTETVQQASQQALAQANYSARDISYLELAATGIEAQDEAEFAGLSQIYKLAESSPPKGGEDSSPWEGVRGAELPTLAVGSVKANIGHTFTASGIASLIKTALCLHGEYLPGTPNWQSPKNGNEWQASPFYVPTDSRPWLQDDQPRRAAINSFGSDRHVAHAILSEPSSDLRPTPAADELPPLNPTEPCYLIPLAGSDEADLLRQLTQLKSQIEATPSIEQLARERYEAFRPDRPEGFLKPFGSELVVALVAADLTKLEAEIDKALKGIPKSIAGGKEWRTPKGSYFTPTPQGRTGEVAFVYPGAFTPYPNLGRDLGYIFPGLFDQFGDITTDLASSLGDTWLYPRQVDTLTKDDLQNAESHLLGDYRQVMSTVTSYAILASTALRRWFKVQPNAAFGYSLGEFSMGWGVGLFTEGDAYNAKLNASNLFNERLGGRKQAIYDHYNLPADTPADELWAVFTLRAAPEQVRPFVANNPEVFLILVNTAKEVVIAGRPAACQQVIDSLGVTSQRAPFDQLLHCPPVMAADYPALVELNSLPTHDIGGTRLYTSSTNSTFAPDTASAAKATADCLCNPVDFPALIERMYADGVRVFIELGPRRTCTGWIKANLADQPHLATAINHSGRTDYVALIQMLAQLVSHQVDLDLAPLYPRPAQPTRKRPALLKQVQLGGPSIIGQIVTDENRQRFADLRAKLAAIEPPTLTEQHGIAPDFTTIDPTQPKQEKIVSQPTTNGVSPEPIPTQELDSRPDRFLKPVRSAPAPELTGWAEQKAKLNEVVRDSIRNHNLFLQQRQKPLQQLYADLQAKISAYTDARGGDSAIKDSAIVRGGDSAIKDIAVLRDGDSAIGNTALSQYRNTALSRPAFPEAFNKPEKVVWDYNDLLEFAGGDISNVFGQQFKVVDDYLRKVRLPLPPYLLVTRITELDAKVGEYKQSFIQTEYDIPVHHWYCTDGQAPSAVAVESGQCDLLLISYLGVDFRNQSDRVYRLLDCTLTFMDDLPVEGQTLRYDIWIKRYAQTAGPLLFFFEYNCYVGDKMVLKMRGGCAGFFTDDELAEGGGVIYTKEELAERANAPRDNFTPILNTSKTFFSQADLFKLSAGDIASVFGAQYEQNGLNPTLRLPPKGILMVDQVTKVDLTGGHRGLGLILADKFIEPDHWYFPCHFKDDEVLAGSLIAEGCVQVMEFFMLHLGLQTKTRDARFQPIPNEPQIVRCRGQVQPQTNLMTYSLEITEIGLEPTPFVKGNVEVLMDGLVTVYFENLSLQLVEKKADDPYRLEQIPAPIEYDYNPPVVVKKPALFNETHIEEFAMGSIPACFGDDFRIFDGRRTPRTPNGPLKLMSRITEFNGTRLKFKSGSNLTCEYDVPQTWWFYEQNSYPNMPYSILMEIALQPCGFLSANLGSTLPYPEIDFYFRNLDGHGTLTRAVDLRGKTIVNRVDLLSSVALQGVVIQKFNFSLSVEGETFYSGFASFGYFTPESLANQVGLDGGEEIKPWREVNPDVPLTQLDLLRDQHTMFEAPANQPHYRLAGQRLTFLDEVWLTPTGGTHGKGYIYGKKWINPDDWFYKAHFHEDPVMPGSLGVEALLEAMQAYVLNQGIGQQFSSPYFEQLEDHKVVWKYRGQIIQKNQRMYLEIHLKQIEELPGQIRLLGDASLWRDGMRIYEVTDIGLSVREGGR